MSLKWWQTWKCTHCHMETRRPSVGQCRDAQDVCPLGIVARFHWMRAIISKFVIYLTNGQHEGLLGYDVLAHPKRRRKFQ